MKHKLLIVAVVLFLVSAVFAVSILAVKGDGELDNEAMTKKCVPTWDAFLPILGHIEPM